MPAATSFTPSRARLTARLASAVAATALVAAGSLAFAAPAQAAAQSAIFDDVAYSFDDAAAAAGATVTGYTQAGRTALTIPDTITVAGVSYPVVAIGDDALSGLADGTGLSSLTLPDSITSIGIAAIAGNELSSIDLPSSLTTVAASAFQTNLLESVTLPDAVRSIGDYAFYQNRISSLDLGAGVTTLGWSAFATNQLTTLAVPDSVTAIGHFAFMFNSLRDVTLGSSVISVGDGAFTLNFPYTPNRIADPDWAGFTPATATLESVVFTGPVPPAADPADFPNFMPAGTGLGADWDRDIYGSLGPAYGVTIYYPWRYGAPQTAGGFSSPAWNLYPTLAIADVSFDMNGHGDQPRTQPITVGTVASEPAPPTEDGWTFTGWYTDAAPTTPFSFRTPITADTVLRAGWTAVVPPAPVTVSFDMNGHGAQLPPQSVAIGGTATAPTAPTAAGWTFTGWHTDAAATRPFLFTTAITADTVLHAGWTAVVVPPTEQATPPAAAPTGSTTLVTTGATDPSGAALVAIAVLFLGGGLLATRRRSRLSQLNVTYYNYLTHRAERLRGGGFGASRRRSTRCALALVVHVGPAE